jgi:hypothetical protein
MVFVFWVALIREYQDKDGKEENNQASAGAIESNTINQSGDHMGHGHHITS